ncbi:hypothetical protein K504DRAFT_459495 [Pleomassaria siparia CBS 279.74]|uniref:Uncharacterized protein n=1 Tax=Pleomassaria siparia CBS 279.74 TaxID=1314801 RepID=A0A6G1JZY7_9PLEO|nr:hypothetical protein K504DRAFT_459495 [Pleomassaria siparia CBS 279.74]
MAPSAQTHSDSATGAVLPSNVLILQFKDSLPEVSEPRVPTPAAPLVRPSELAPPKPSVPATLSTTPCSLHHSKISHSRSRSAPVNIPTPPQPTEDVRDIEVPSLIPLPRPDSSGILPVSGRESTVFRFKHLLETCTDLVHRHGPYKVKKKVFERASRSPKAPLSATQVATSLACAQDALPYTQPAGPANDDLQHMANLWNTAIEILSSTLAHRHALSLTSFGWGAYGLCTGYIPSDSHSSALDKFMRHKLRLYAFLKELPLLEAENLKRQHEAVGNPYEKVGRLVIVRRGVHINATILLQIIWEDGGWENVRWFHAISVVERLIGAMSLE